MFFQRYILTTYRLLVERWWLSLIKLCSLTMGMIAFSLVWLFYIDHATTQKGRIFLLNLCTLENLLILGSIIIITITIYLLILRSQMTVRYKEFFIRKLYGESTKGITHIIMIETVVFVLTAFVLSLVMVDQVAPLFNLITERDINTQQIGSEHLIWAFVLFFILIGLLVWLFTAITCSRRQALDLLKKLPE
jgi:hypothetical protein